MNLFLMSCTFYILFNKFLPTLMSQHPLLYLFTSKIFKVLFSACLHFCYRDVTFAHCVRWDAGDLMPDVLWSSPPSSNGPFFSQPISRSSYFYQNWQNRGAWFWTLNTVPSTIRLSTYQCYSLVIIIIL